MTKNQSYSLIGFAVVLALFGFQNCSKVGVADASGFSSNKVSGEGVVSQDPPTLPDPGSAPVVTDGSGDDSDIVKQDDGDVEKRDDGKKEGHTCNGDHGKKDDHVPGKSEDQMAGADDSGDELVDINESDAAALCLGDKANSRVESFRKAASISGPEVTHMRGAISVESDDLTLVEDIRGLLVIRGKSGAASAKLIHNTRGAMVICGLSVDQIDDSRGLVVLVNSNVKSIHDHRGAVMLMNSKVDSTSDIRGVVKEIKK